jgi:hypothetical protein
MFKMSKRTFETGDEKKFEALNIIREKIDAWPITSRMVENNPFMSVLWDEKPYGRDSTMVRIATRTARGPLGWWSGRWIVERLGSSPSSTAWDKTVRQMNFAARIELSARKKADW